MGEHVHCQSFRARTQLSLPEVPPSRLGEPLKGYGSVRSCSADRSPVAAFSADKALLAAPSLVGHAFVPSIPGHATIHGNFLEGSKVLRRKVLSFTAVAPSFNG